MNWKRIRLRLKYWRQRNRRHELLWDEMEFHIDEMAAHLIEQGMPEQAARAAARRKFGNMTQTSEDSRATWIAQWLDETLQDLKHAFRSMRREAGFTTFVVLIAGLGIGASSTIFSVVNALLLRPLPFRDANHLVWIANQEWSTQVGIFLDLREHNKSFSDMAGYGFYNAGDSALTGTGEPERITRVPVTQNFFSLLGVEPTLGRSFTDEECQGKVDSPAALILSHGFWQRRFASDPNIIGRKVILNNRPRIVVGVLPASFDFASIFAPGIPVDAFIPWPLTAETNRQGNTMKVIGRLRPGATAESAQAEFTVLGQQISTNHPEWNGIKPKLSLLEKHVSGRISTALIVLACAVGVVMLIVCANLSNLQLARLGKRQKEMAMRAALGAGRMRLLRQMLAENIALSCCGAALGLLLAWAGTRAIAHLDAFNLPLLASVKLDGAALTFTLFAAVLTGVLFGLLPALQVRSFAIVETLKDGGRGSSTSGRAWVRSALVVSEIAFACTLLVGARLLLRSFLRVLDVNLGFQPERAAVMRVDPSFRFKNLQEQNAYFDDLLHRTRALPGIAAAGLADVLPFYGDRSWQVSGVGQTWPKDKHPESYIRVVTDGYFDAVGIRLMAGRFFTENDRAASEPVVIINESLARTLWPRKDPIGQSMTQNGGRRIVGVVADVRHEAVETAGGSEMYMPMRQNPDYFTVQLVVSTTLPADRLSSAVVAALRPIDPNLPAAQFKTLQQLVDKAGSPRRFVVLLLTGFAIFALLLASLGIYAVVSYSVNQRVQEIGIRMALGASATDLQASILMSTLSLAALGLAVGMLASRALTTTLSSMLFGVTAGDPVTFIGIGALLILVAALAGYFPARRASRIDPMAALRM